MSETLPTSWIKMKPQRTDGAHQIGLDWQQEANLPAHIPTKRLLALLKASDEMMESVFRRSRQDTLDTLASSVKSLLEAEAAAIFLTDEDSPDELILSAYKLDKPHKIEAPRLKIQDVPKGGMTGFIASKGEVVRLHGAALRDHPNKAGASTAHLISGQGFSVLGFPLKDRKGRVLGVAKVDNKKGSDGAGVETAFFDEVDEFIAKILVNKIVLVLEGLRNFGALRDLMDAMGRAKSLDDILNDILKTGMRLIGADRGDFVWWDAGKHRLVTAAQYGTSELKLGEESPEPSVVYEVWRTGEPALIGDVESDEKYSDKYHAAYPLTKSEIAVRLEYDGKKIGVLNAESSKPDWFNKHDLELLQLLAQYATVAAQVIDEEVAFRGIVQNLTEHSPSREEVLTNILQSVANSFGFDAGAIFIADYERGILQGSATVGCDELQIDPTSFEYPLGETALVTKVLRECKGYFSRNPKTDPEVHQRGVQGFKIDGPLVGVPLVYRDKAVGVLVSWSRHKHQQPDQKHIDLLKPFAALAGTTIALSEIERERARVLLKIASILDQMQTELNLKKNLQSILSGVQEAGFDRVRVFAFQEESQSFIGLSSVGMESAERVEGFRVFAEKNPYILHTIQHWSTERRARLYDSSMFGPDPDAPSLKKDPDLPWAVVPLVTNSKLYGYISADNTTTRRMILEGSLQYLTLYGALACQAIVNRQTIDLLGGSKIRDEFLRRMAHIFGTHASNIKLMIGNLESNVINYSQFKITYMPGILKINKNYLELGQRMRDFAALGADTKLNIKSDSLERLVADAIERLQGPAAARGISFKVSVTSPLLWRIDVARASSAVEALLENAIKFSPVGKTVHVLVETDEKAARIIVRDEGFGIPEEELRFVFDSFFRARNAVDAHIEGTGLGLSIVARTMELHGGTATARNHPDGGAEFTLEFPRRS
ncbi:MAG: GAF domain-containing protein [Pyrinomonadaceae bacterium]